MLNAHGERNTESSGVEGHPVHEMCLAYLTREQLCIMLPAGANMGTVDSELYDIAGE